RCISLGIALAEGLDCLHRIDFVHRDVGAENVLIPADRRQPPMLLDFDSVAPVGTRGSAGTTAVEPPEIALGEPWSVQSDVYALALMLTELLTAKPAESLQAQARPLGGGARRQGGLE